MNSVYPSTENMPWDDTIDTSKYRQSVFKHRVIGYVIDHEVEC